MRIYFDPRHYVSRVRARAGGGTYLIMFASALGAIVTATFCYGAPAGLIVLLLVVFMTLNAVNLVQAGISGLESLHLGIPDDVDDEEAEGE